MSVSSFSFPVGAGLLAGGLPRSSAGFCGCVPGGRLIVRLRVRCRLGVGGLRIGRLAVVRLRGRPGRRRGSVPARTAARTSPTIDRALAATLDDPVLHVSPPIGRGVADRVQDVVLNLLAGLRIGVLPALAIRRCASALIRDCTSAQKSCVVVCDPCGLGRVDPPGTVEPAGDAVPGQGSLPPGNGLVHEADVVADDRRPRDGIERIGRIAGPRLDPLGWSSCVRNLSMVACSRSGMRG